MQKLMKAMHKSEKGFTLVELMVVVVIIAVLVAIAIPIYSGIQRSAAESAHDANVRTLKGAASIWYAEHGTTQDGFVLMEAGTFHHKDGDGASQPDDPGEGDLQSSYFGNYIEGGAPTVPALLKDDEDLAARYDDQTRDQPDGDYHVTVDANGEVTVKPGIGAYGT